jgi:hypothetical protein
MLLHCAPPARPSPSSALSRSRVRLVFSSASFRSSFDSSYSACWFARIQLGDIAGLAKARAQGRIRARSHQRRCRRTLAELESGLVVDVCVAHFTEIATTRLADAQLVASSSARATRWRSGIT